MRYDSFKSFDTHLQYRAPSTNGPVEQRAHGAEIYKSLDLSMVIVEGV